MGGLDPLTVEIDLIQSRYGWSDMQIKRLPLARYEEIVETIAALNSQKTLDKWHRSAFVAWLFGCGGEDMQFNSFLEGLGLGYSAIKPSDEGVVVTIGSEKEAAEKAARRVMDAFGIQGSE